MAREVIGLSVHADKAPASARLKDVRATSTTHGGETVWVLQEGVTAGARAQDSGGGVYTFVTAATTGLKHIETPSGVVLSVS